MSLAPGDVVEHFVIVAPLGEGGMGRVYVARDTRLQRSVALKIVHPEKGDAGSGGAARLMREAQAAAALTHPNVVTIYEVGEVRSPGAEHGHPFIAMELVKGRTLRALAADPGVPLERRVAWLTDVARALAAAHRAGLVHRDVKPENVMVGDDGVVKVLDFGVAKRTPSAPVASDTPTEDATGTLTGQGVTVGTPYYMAPEQMRGEPLDGRADQFAWGVLAYELVAGTPPWGRGLDALQLVSKLLSEDAPPLASLRPEAPAPLVDAIARTMKKRRDDRFPSMDALLDALGEAITPRAVTPARSSANAIENAPTELAHPTARRARRGPLVAAAAIVVLLGAALAAWRGSRASRAEGSVAPASTAPTTAITPAPVSANAQAAAEYEAAMQAWRDGSSSAGERGMERAAALDPSLAAARVREALWSELARFTIVGTIIPDEPRAIYAEARARRGSATDYDRAFIDAVEPRYRPSVDLAESEARLTALSARFPDRGEPLYWLAYTQASRGDRVAATRTAAKAEALEPSLAPALLAMRASVEGSPTAARALLDRCVALSPSAADCLGERARSFGNEGRCDAMAADAHAWVAADPDDAHAHLALGEALFAGGAPIESVRDALDAMEKRSPDVERAVMAPHHRVALALGAGDFVTAIAEGRAFEKSVASSESVSVRWTGSLELEVAAMEAGDTRTAGDSATAFLKRASALTPGSDVERVMPAAILAIAAKSGAIGRDELVRRRAAIQRDAESRMATASEQERTVTWFYGYAMAAVTPEDARDALAALARYPKLEVPDAISATRASVVGGVYELAGDHAAAIPYLRRATGNCYLLNAVDLAMRARLWLANALAATGKTDEARALYRSVIDRWGSAKPRSITAERARAGLAALGE